MNIDYNELIQYAVLFTIPFLLMWCHNWLISHAELKVDQQLTTERYIKEKIGVSLALFIGTVLLMLFLAPSLQDLFNGYGLFAIGFALISSFLIVRFFMSALLKQMRGRPIFFKFLINKNLLVAVFFIIATELLVLYWLKELNTYFRDQFVIFVIGYSVLITLGGIFLSLPKQKGQILHAEWRDNVVTIIDPLIVMFFATILVKIILTIILHFLYT
ncbi:MAG: hypothetical protein DRR08_21780 [Candidatus Parabeggiatoa sp. nov. 2]|nr:MAG: hypothetical protein B6247_31265 [Beggiatoa sp. 4572_84]RKZ56407.1 MAG: hypothetical protein DRR08_21780 [Gammaproteobacteria bacterium]